MTKERLPNLSIFYFFGYLIDEAAEVPKKLANAPFFQQVVWPWLLFGAILCIIHSSQLITELNSPLKGEELENFTAVQCSSDKGVQFNSSKYFKRYATRFIYNFKLIPDKEKHSCFYILSKPNSWSWLQNKSIISLSVCEFSQNIPLNEYDPIHKSIDNKYEKDIMFHLLHPYMRWYPSEISGCVTNSSHHLIWEKTEKELVKCRRSIFVGMSSYLEHYKEQILDRAYPKAKFYMRTEHKLRWDLKFWKFSNQKSRIPSKFKVFKESGIYDKITRMVSAAKMVGEHNFKKMPKDWDLFSTVSLSGSIQTIFIIAVFGWTLSLLAFGLEERLILLKACGWIWFGAVDLFKKVWIFLVTVLLKGIKM